MTTFARSEFPVRPYPNAAESLPGYLFRLYNANGHTLPRELCTLLRELHTADNLGELDEVIGEMKLILGPALDGYFDDDTWIHERFHFSVAPLWHRWSLASDLHLRFCPRCLENYRYHLILWELSHVTVCPLHRCRLLEHCPNCSRTLSWRTLRIDWTCICGCALTEMYAVPVSGIASAISAFLCNALDARRPPGYPTEPLSRIVGERVRLEYAYLRLHDFEWLRAFILRLTADEYYSAWRTSFHARRYIGKPGRWTTRLLFEWPRGFQRSLLRLARFHFRDHTLTFLQIAPPTRELATIDFLCAIEEYSWIDAPIRAATLQLIQSFKAPFPFRSLVIYSPHLTETQHALRLTTFSQWWKSQCIGRQQLDLGSQPMTGNSFGYPESDSFREEAIIRIINVMIAIANAGLDTNEVRRLIGCLPLLHSSSENDNPEAILKALAAQLALFPNRTISDMREVVWDVEQILAA